MCKRQWHMLEVVAPYEEEKGTFSFAHSSEKLKLGLNELRIFVTRKMHKIKNEAYSRLMFV